MKASAGRVLFSHTLEHITSFSRPALPLTNGEKLK